MPEPGIRAVHVLLTEVHREGGRAVDPPARRVIAVAAVANPLAGVPDAQDLGVLEELGATVAGYLVQRALEVLASAGVSPSEVRGYGKGAIVGTDGELEHTAAVLHPKFGAPVRAAIGGGADIIPGTKKVGVPGSSITMPIGNKDDRWVFDDMDAAEISMPDAPRSDEMVIALVLSSSPRAHARVKKPGG